MQIIKKLSDGSFISISPKFPEHVSEDKTPLFPLVDAQTKVFAAAIAIAATQQKTIVVVGTLTGDTTLNVTVDEQVEAGAELIVLMEANSSPRTVTLGTGITGDAITVDANKELNLLCKYDGSNFRPVNVFALPDVQAADVQSKDYAATIAVTVTRQRTIVNVAQLTGAATVDLTIDAGVVAGAELVLKLQSDTTARAVTLGTGTTGTAVAGTISKTKYANFVYDGSTFVHLSTNQVD